MSGKQAKTLSADHIDDLLFFADRSRHPLRNRLIVLLSVKAGLRAAEIAKLTWDMVVDPAGEIGTVLELHDRVAKKGSGRSIPLHKDLREVLIAMRRLHPGHGVVIQSERGGPMTPLSIVDGLAAHTRPSALKAARLILAAGPSSRAPREWCTRPEGHFETFSCWQGIDPSRQPNAISTAIVMCSAASLRCCEK
jgi:integrase